MTDDVVPTQAGLDDLAEILAEALAATPWLARIASDGRATCAVRAMVSVDDWHSQLDVAVMDPTTEEIVEHWRYADLEPLRATRARMLAYATCVAGVVARASPADRLSDLIPAPALLALVELATAADFERARRDVELEEQAVAQLRAARE